MISYRVGRRRVLQGLALAAAGASIGACAAPAPPPTAPAAATPGSAPKPVSTAAAPAKPTSPPAESKPAAVKPPATARPVVKATLAFPAPSITQAVYAVAKESGYFREEGIDLEMQEISSANAVKAMLGGQGVEFASTVTDILSSIGSGAAAKVILLTAKGPVAWLYARPQYKSIADLKGAIVSIGAPGDYSQNMMRAILIGERMNPDSDVSYVQIPGSARNRLQALFAGSADVTVVTPPDNLVADQEGMNRLLFLSDRVKITTNGAGTTDALIKEKPELVRAFVRANVKALMLLKEVKEAAVPLLAKFMDVKPEQAAAMYDAVRSTYTEGFVDDDVLQTTIAETERVAKQTIPLSKAFDLSFAKQAVQEIRASGWKPR